MASMNTGFKTLAKESGSSGSFSFNVRVASDFGAPTVCFRGCPWSTNVDIEYTGFEEVETVSLLAVLYSSRMW